MKISNLLKINLKPFIYHVCLVLLGTGIIGANWNSARNEAVLITFILMVLLHFAVGFLLTNQHTWYDNLLSVSVILIFNGVLYMYNKVDQTGFQSLMDGIVIVFKFPFLYILGWHGPNYPLLVIFLPSLLLWFGLECKSQFYKLKR
ncbi:putative membrane protein YdbT with pleckstrin-like domain [Alkalibacillus flavidus]|uniref:Membrane protein YdbT with pleckstrin-like domain n=1 Tax=Alkalibacillus flavidus TaxID=546021 RepID=A0ABV2KV24_9BACI